MNKIELLDLHPASETFLDDVLSGLDQHPRSLPCKYFYDERGSALFDQICDLDEYYLTRTELAIMAASAEQIVSLLGENVALVELGSGSSVKTRILLDAAPNLAAYVPVDISREHLQKTSAEINQRYPDLTVLPVCADFVEHFELPWLEDDVKPTVYFPGSTIGNFEPEAAEQLMRSIADRCGADGHLLIGIDLQKDVATIEAAYNDADGVTVEFNKNLLHRINRELDANFDVDGFEHRADYNPQEGRVEISLECMRPQIVHVAGKRFEFEQGDSIHTEYSHKYNPDQFAKLAATAGFEVQEYWTDDNELFAVYLLRVVD